MCIERHAPGRPTGGGGLSPDRGLSHWPHAHLPLRYIRNLRVEFGGYGEGTVIGYDMIVFGRTNHLRARVTEPEPGRMLVERNVDKHIVTTFIVDPLGAFKSRVTIATDVATRAGLFGWIERVVIRSYLARAYAELARIGEQAAIHA